MEHRENREDRRDDKCKQWDSIMAEVEKHRAAADQVDARIAEIRALINNMEKMSTTTKG
jgi:prefoldin subunit 5